MTQRAPDHNAMGPGRPYQYSAFSEVHCLLDYPGVGLTLVPASLRQMHIDGVVYRPLDGRAQPRAVLNLVSRRGDPSAVIRHFLNLVRQSAKDFALNESKRGARP